MEEIILKLKQMKLKELKVMANEINVSFDTLLSIRIGRNNNPRFLTVLAIQEFLNKQ